jgi:uncharacterized protein (DUF111 family)
VPPPPGFRLLAAGVGAGTKDFPKHPNILRVLIGEVSTSVNVPAPLPLLDSNAPSSSSGSSTIGSSSSPAAAPPPAALPPAALPVVAASETGALWVEEELVLLEANIDDMTAELVGYLLEQLLLAGARDAWAQPIVMKKGRPAVTVSALCTPEGRSKLLLVVFQQSTSIGVRTSTVQRAALRRKFVALPTQFGDVQAKVSFLGDRPVTVKPEFDDCRAVADRHGVPLKRVQDAAHVAAEALYDLTFSA